MEKTERISSLLHEAGETHHVVRERMTVELEADAGRGQHTRIVRSACV